MIALISIYRAISRYIDYRDRPRRRTYIALLFEFQWLKIGCFKTAVLKNA